MVLHFITVFLILMWLAFISCLINSIKIGTMFHIYFLQFAIGFYAYKIREIFIITRLYLLFLTTSFNIHSIGMQMLTICFCTLHRHQVSPRNHTKHFMHVDNETSWHPIFLSQSSNFSNQCSPQLKRKLPRHSTCQRGRLVMKSHTIEQQTLQTWVIIISMV